MKNKKCRVFLWISLTLFALSLIAVTLEVIVEYYEAIIDFPNIGRDQSFVLVGIVFVCLWITIPSLASELSCIRSIYKILKYKPIWYVKLCYIISASLAFLAFTFSWLCSFGLINLDKSSGGNLTTYILLLIEWPFFILSFILGSIPIKHNNCSNTSKKRVSDL